MAAGRDPAAQLSRKRPPVLQQFVSDAACQALNHSLRRERAARELLIPLAGRTARITAGPFHMTFEIAADGSLRTGRAQPDVTIEIDSRSIATALSEPGALSEPAALLEKASVHGDAALARALMQVAARLRPDPEEDLSRVVGDAAAVRVVAALRAAHHGARDVGARAARQLADYLAGERAWLASRGPFERFAAEVNELARAAERLVERAGGL